MKKYYNDGQSESNILQNRFTAYLSTAIQRKKYAYVAYMRKHSQAEVSIEEQEMDCAYEENMIQGLPVIEQLNHCGLVECLKQAKERDLEIFFMRALEDKSFQDIAYEKGMGYKAVTMSYYRFVKKIREKLEEKENNNEF